MNKYPIYIISKGRWESRLTAKALEVIGANWNIVVEPQEYDAYCSVIDSQRVLVLPCSNLGQGSIPARNWVWQHSIEHGSKRHWILDDNIRRFYRLHENIKYHVKTTATFEAIEDFADRYVNIPMCGMNYELFQPAGNKANAITWNTRIYSCILLANKKPLWWRGRYNEDTDLSLRYLKQGDCTALFNAFLCKKIATMTMKGGNTESLYEQNKQFDGRLVMAQSLQKQHPDVVTVTQKWGRWQHHVDYRPFKKNALLKNKDTELQHGINEFGMKLVNRNNEVAE